MDINADLDVGGTQTQTYSSNVAKALMSPWYQVAEQATQIILAPTETWLLDTNVDSSGCPQSGHPLSLQW